MEEGDIDIIKAPIVIDNVSPKHITNIVKGSGVMKAGMGGGSEPQLVF